MPQPKPPPDSSTDSATTPQQQRNSATKHTNPSTPTGRKFSSNGGATPKSAPAAAGAGAGPAGAAGTGTPQRKKAEPTLLHDFLLGRPSPARLAAQRAGQGQRRDKRRRSVAAPDAAGVREELRQEMRAAAVRRLQQRPGGVQDRVREWQKANAGAVTVKGPAAAATRDVVEATPTEPTEILVDVDEASVTEEDRLRIRARQKSRSRKPSKARGGSGGGPDAKDETVGNDGGGAAQQETASDPKSGTAPKKRIISDGHWMKKGKGRSPPRPTAAAKPKVEGSPMPIPKDFLLRTAQNPSVKNKIKDWALRVEVPEPTQAKKRQTKSDGGFTIDDDVLSTADSSDVGRPRPRKPTDDGVRVRLARTRKPKSETDDGIRIKPIRKKEPPDDGIRVRPLDTALPDDGIRVRPGPPTADDEATERGASSRQESAERSTRVSGAMQDPPLSDMIEVIEEPESEVYTPTKRKGSAKRKPRRTVTPTTVTRTEETEDGKSWMEESDRFPHHEDWDAGSERPSIAPGAKSLADIPVGYSAFSELDLPLGADARNSVRRPKGQRNPSFKAVPNVFKKVVSEGKKIIHDKVDPPKPVFKQPPSIESWLSNTVDPFVDSKPKRASVEKEWVQDSGRRSSETRPQGEPQLKPADDNVDQENADPKVDDEITPKKKTPGTATGTGLKRSRATRSASSPLKSGPRKPFREQLKDAFRGESGGHKLPLVMNPRSQAEPDQGQDQDKDQDGSDWDNPEPRRQSSGSNKRSPSPEPLSTIESTIDSAPSTADLPKRKPPTSGFHALSTILSEDSSSTYRSDTASTVSQTTVTQTTTPTESTGLSREKSRKSGLKRRLTKHSDLVSVLSLPDGQLIAPSRVKSLRSSHSTRKKTSKPDGVNVEDLLQEFADDEHFYQKELKTLVDGVVPVLLTSVVHGDTPSAPAFSGRDTLSAPAFGGHIASAFSGDAPSAPAFDRDLAPAPDRGLAPAFGGSLAPAQKAKAMAKAVVSMGVVLEELKYFHKRVPLSDIHSLLAWLQSVYPLYDNYLDVWRLGFEGLIVNLAPASGKPDDEDSLVNAMPRNEEGDVLDHNGERVDVAQLLKRPLTRIRWFVKFLMGAQRLLGVEEAKMLLAGFEKLQEKARRRHREEKARKTDEDASSTDTTRTRDLRTLAAIDSVVIDQSRQVNAKDTFSLDFIHSSGQRIECRIDLIYRDNINIPADKGDVIIRETGPSSRSWLLFPAIPKAQISARTGDGDGVLTVMVRGRHNKQEWHELIRLSADDKEQVADWLDILGSNPMPPPLPTDLANHAVPSSKADDGANDPAIEGKHGQQSPGSPAPKTPSRYHQRSHSIPKTLVTPPASEDDQSTSPSRTPTQESFLKASQRHSLPIPPSEDHSNFLGDTPKKLTKSLPNSTPYREDGAPPPPIHRTLGTKTKTPPSLAPVELGHPTRMKRRTSSPLKHEYRPSDISSGSSDSSDDSDSLTESSSDELDELDEPGTPATLDTPQSIKTDPTPRDSVVSDSSLTPSNSASQAVTPELKDSSEYAVKSLASVSYWSNRVNNWKDISVDTCSIVVSPGLVEVFPLNAAHSPVGKPESSSSAETANGGAEAGTVRPLIALELTPHARIRLSTVIDVEVRYAPVQSRSLIRKGVDSSTFRFRTPSKVESRHLFDAVYHSCENNSKFQQLQEEARISSFGQQQQQQDQDQAGEGSADDSSSKRRRTWFGRKNSYRASARAPSQSQGSSSGMSASSFLRRLTAGGNLPFDIGKSTLDKQSRPGSVAGVPPASMYTSSAASSGSRSGFTFPRLPSVSMAESNARNQPLGTTGLKIRLHRLVRHHKWEDHGNCTLDITRPDPGTPQQLRPYHGWSKRIVVRSVPKKAGEEPLTLVDLTVGSSCFSTLGNTGVVVNVWEELRDADGNVGAVPAQGGISGGVRRWCLQCPNVAQWMWVMNLVTQEGFAD